MPTADQVRSLVRERCKALKISFKRLSLESGQWEGYFSEFLNGKQATIDEDARVKAAVLLQVDEKELKVEEYAQSKGTVEPRNARIGGAVRVEGHIPSFASSRAGKDGQFTLNRVGTTNMAPPRVASAKNGYAVHVVDGSMEDRYRAGEVVYAIPDMPLVAGDYVVAKVTTDAGAEVAYIKRLVSYDEKKLVVEQLRPKKTFEFPANRIVSVDKIFMGGEE